MAVNLKTWLKKALAHSGMGQAELARELGYGDDRSKVNKMVTGIRTIHGAELLEIARITGFPAPDQMKASDRLRVNIVGDIGAGEEIYAFDDEAMGGGEPLEAPPDVSPDAVGVRVAGDSMVPELDDNDIIIYDRQYQTDFDRFLKKRVVVALPDGRRYVKRLYRGSAPGLYTLRSTNPRIPDIEDQYLAWVAPIAWIKPA